MNHPEIKPGTCSVLRVFHQCIVHKYISFLRNLAEDLFCSELWLWRYERATWVLITVVWRIHEGGCKTVPHNRRMHVRKRFSYRAIQLRHCFHWQIFSSHIKVGCFFLFYGKDKANQRTDHLMRSDHHRRRPRATSQEL